MTSSHQELSQAFTNIYSQTRIQICEITPLTIESEDDENISLYIHDEYFGIRIPSSFFAELGMFFSIEIWTVVFKVYKNRLELYYLDEWDCAILKEFITPLQYVHLKQMLDEIEKKLFPLNYYLLLNKK